MSQEINNNTVKTGIIVGAIATLTLFIILYLLVPQYSDEVTLLDRMKLAVECLVFPALFMLIVILKVGSQRFGNPAENPVQVVANTDSMKIDLRVLSNTHEQLIIFVINMLGLSILLPYNYLSLLPIYSCLFVVGRIIFWFAYKHNVLWRAPGFAMCVLPAAVGLLYSCSVILMNTFF